MTGYIVAYDLNKEGQNYECMTKKLEAYGTYCHLQRSVWIISTKKSAKEIRDNLSECIDSNDKLFVGALTGEAAWQGFKAKTSDWIENNI